MSQPHSNAGFNDGAGPREASGDTVEYDLTQKSQSAAPGSTYLATHKWRLLRGAGLLFFGIVLGTSVGGTTVEDSDAYKTLNAEFSSIQSELAGAKEDLTKAQDSAKEHEGKVKDLDSELTKLKSERDSWQDQTDTIAERDENIASLDGQIAELSTQRDECQADLASTSSSNSGSTNASGSSNASQAVNPAPAPAAAPASASNNVYYRNCTAAREAGAAPVHRGDPGYGSHLDRDNDGIGCE